MRICLCLMTLKGYSVLQKIVQSELRSMIGTVVAGRDKNIDNDYAQEIIDCCKEHGIPCSERKQELPEDCQYMIAVSWRWTINTTNSILIVLHDSLLPKYRGFAPLVNQLINHEPFVGVTALFANEEYDRGNIIAQKKTAIAYPIKIADAIDQVSALYSELVLEIFQAIHAGKLKEGSVQEESEATYSLWRDDQDYLINWHSDAARIKRFIDAVGHPYAGAETLMGEKKIKILDAEVEPDVKIVNRDIGKVIFMREGFPVVVCREGLLKITNAVYQEDGKSIFPLNKFRLRFQ